MKKFLKRLFSFSPEKPAAQAPENHAILPQKTNSSAADYTPGLSYWISRITLVDPDPEKQLSKRKEAFTQIQQAGKEAGSAIPALINSLFSHNQAEVDAARITLLAIDPNWHNHQLALEKIPFLIKKLTKDFNVANRAITILQEMGEPACTALLDAMKNDTENDTYFLSNVLKAFPEGMPREETLLPVIGKLLATDSDQQFTAGVIDIFAKRNWESVDARNLIVPLLTHKFQLVRHKALYFFADLDTTYELAAPGMLKFLSDENAEVRYAAVHALSRIDLPLLETFYVDVVKGQGVIKDEELKGLMEKLGFWSKRNIELYELNAKTLSNNLSWYLTGLRLELEKPGLLLQSVLRILQNRDKIDPELLEPLVSMVNRKEKTDVIICALPVLAKYKGRTDEVLPVMLQFLDHSDDRVRQTVFSALHHLDNNWLDHAQSVEAVEQLIDKLDSNSRNSAQQSLEEAGVSVLPVLSKRLEESKNRIIQQSILDILDKMGDGAVNCLPDLQKMQQLFSNAQTLDLLKALIQKLESGNN